MILALQVRAVPPTATSSQQVEMFGEPTIVLDAEKAWLGADAFWPLVKSGDPVVRHYALRAIGRLEDPANVRPLLALGQQPRGPARDAADAIVQSLYQFDPARDPDLVAAVSAWFLNIAWPDTSTGIPPAPTPLGGVRYHTEEQFHAAERRLITILETIESEPAAAGLYADTASSLESLIRNNPKYPQLDEATMKRLPTMVAGMHRNDPGLPQAAAYRILMPRGLDAETERTALKSPSSAVLVRLAAQVLATGGGGLDADERLDTIQELLKTATGPARYEALRAYARFAAPTRGCQPLLDAIGDPDPAAMTEALDALGQACKDDEEITKRIEQEVRVPPATGRWQRETRLFIALAKRSPERAELFLPAFTSHPSFWVRMYSVHAVVAAKDLPRLEKLAYDADDNVREAALEPLLVLKKVRNDPVLIDDLGRTDVQLLRSAAILAKQAPADRDLGAALVGALLRLTAEGKESARDGRLALIDALDVHGRAEHVAAVRPLLRDFDPMVAAAAARLLARLGAGDVRANPLPLRRGWAQQFIDLPHQCVSVALSTGHAFRMRMAPSGAPIAVGRFLKLALVDHYYDRLTFHRVVPNFVIQGGSPGANEYSGHKEYMRDEIALPNTAGSVGLSIRGRNTGDAQFYINLVDNPRLDHGYTVFAQVLDMDVVEQVMEGDVIQSITSTKCAGR